MATNFPFFGTSWKNPGMPQHSLSRIYRSGWTCDGRDQVWISNTKDLDVDLDGVFFLGALLLLWNLWTQWIAKRIPYQTEMVIFDLHPRKLTNIPSKGRISVRNTFSNH